MVSTSWRAWGWWVLGIAAAILTGPAPALAASEVVSSTQRVDSDGNGAAGLAFDGDLGTSWVEGAPGLGAGEWIEVRFDRPQDVRTVTLFGGRFTSRADFADYAHVQRARISWIPAEGEPGEVMAEIPDRYAPVTVAVGAPVRSVKLTIEAVYDGARYSEANVAEIALNWGLPDEGARAALDKFKASRAGKPRAEGWDASVAAALAQLQAGEALAEAIPVLTQAVALGNAVDREWLLKTGVPPGFALTYLQADLKIVEALGQKKVVSALPALDRAAAREWDPARRGSLDTLAKWMAAYEVYSAPTPAGIPFWGSRGTIPGMLQSRGEPLSVAVASDGSVFVADVGNNRIQRFDPSGRVTATTAGKRTIDSTWFGRPVDPFVVGAAASSEPGRFHSPLYLTLVHDGPEERVVVVDSTLRVQVLSLDLQPLAAWTLPEKVEVLSGVGLRWPLLVELRSGEVGALVGDMVLVYDLQGEEKMRFQLEGEPMAAAVQRRRLLVAYAGDQVVAYTLEGLKDKVFFTLPREQTTEDMDLTVDDTGMLIIHTDAGYAYQVDKKGRLVQVQRTFKSPTRRCRIAARGGVLYVTAQDSIQRFELLVDE